MLIDKVKECTAAINELSDLRSSASGLQAFERAVDHLAAVDVLAADFVSAFEEMNKTDFCKPNLSIEDIEPLKRAIVNCASRVNGKRLETNDADALKQAFQAKKIF